MTPTMDKPTAATFRDPMLRVLGRLTNLTPGVEVQAEEALRAVYEDTGYEEGQFGADESEGKPYIRVVAVRAVNRMLKRDGLVESGGRGVWALTEDGVRVASLLVGDVPDEGDEDIVELDRKGAGLEPVEDASPPVDVPAAKHGGGGGLSWSLGPQENHYNPDPYIRGLAVGATKCFGNLSERSDKCDTCPISGACKAQCMVAVAEYAAKLRQRDEEARRRAAIPEPEPEPEPEPDEPEDNEDIQEILDLIEGHGGREETELPPHTEMDVPADTRCSHCHKKVPQLTKGIWARDEGMFHPECFLEKHGRPKTGGEQGKEQP